MVLANPEQYVESLRQQTRDLDARALLSFFIGLFPGKITLASSLGAEDQVLTDIIHETSSEVPIFTLDTGRLPEETYRCIEATHAHYGIRIRHLCPDAGQIEALVNAKGPDCFYASIENRKRCCHIRKVEPLKRYLTGFDAWICGLRRMQSVTRSEVERIEWDATHDMIKINPLADWSLEQVWEYIRNRNFPYNKLHDQGYASIGCAPCTRAIRPGDDERSGRWWWEKPEQKECGLHMKDGKITRKDKPSAGS